MLVPVQLQTSFVTFMARDRALPVAVVVPAQWPTQYCAHGNSAAAAPPSGDLFAPLAPRARAPLPTLISTLAFAQDNEKIRITPR